MQALTILPGYGVIRLIGKENGGNKIK